MAVIGICGPNAVGKTTFVYRMLDRYGPNLVAAIADNQWEARSRVDKARVHAWKGTVEEKEALVRKHQQANHVCVIDSVRTTALNYFSDTDPVIIVTCTYEKMGEVLRARCAKKGKRFRADYWDQWKLGYESAARYLNFASKNLNPAQVRHFVIEDQARDWPAVDTYFGQLYRRIYNKILRRKRGAVEMEGSLLS
jgi:molybdopterin-guanine dinucleotide biosynthesis protein